MASSNYSTEHYHIFNSCYLNKCKVYATSDWELYDCIFHIEYMNSELHIKAKM